MSHTPIAKIELLRPSSKCLTLENLIHYVELGTVIGLKFVELSGL